MNSYNKLFCGAATVVWATVFGIVTPKFLETGRQIGELEPIVERIQEQEDRYEAMKDLRWSAIQNLGYVEGPWSDFNAGTGEYDYWTNPMDTHYTADSEQADRQVRDLAVAVRTMIDRSDAVLVQQQEVINTMKKHYGGQLERLDYLCNKDFNNSLLLISSGAISVAGLLELGIFGLLKLYDRRKDNE